jgi:hypothetical protein
MVNVARVPKFLGATAIATLAACAGGATRGPDAAPMLPRAQNATHARSTAQNVYVSDEGAGAVFVYPAGVSNPTPTAEITDGISDPLGIDVDRHGTLYVANFNGGSGAGSVTVYKAGSTHPSLTITDVSEPTSVAVDASGNLYVGENTSQTVEIAEFAPGAMQPSTTVFPTKLPGFPFMGGMTVDRSNNLYAAFFIYFKPPVHVVKFAPGLTNERDLTLSGLDLLDFNPGLARDGMGNVYVGTFGGVNVYAKGSKKVARTIDISTPQYSGATPDGTLYVPDQTSVEIYAPGAQEPEAMISNSLVLPEGVAIH